MARRKLEIRDPIHGFIELDETEAKLVDTEAFQRLRGIRQLAMASLVYPGAVHTRFDHSLGVLHVAGMMATKLLDHEAVELIRLAALLHDIGHGPFSHVSESALDRYADRTSLGEGQKQEKIHEVVTAGIIQTDPEIGKILGKRMCSDIVDLLSKGYGEPVLRAVVSGPLDADKQDYLLRDSYFCGVRYGVFDLHQLHRSLDSMRHEGTRDLMIEPKGVHAVEQYVLAKYYMTMNVYRHKVRLVTDQMIVRAIALGIEKDGIPALRDLYAFDNSEHFLMNYMKWDDARFLKAFGGDTHKGTRCHSVLERLIQRRLLKRVFQDKPKSFSPQARENVTGLSKLEQRSIRQEIEGEIGQKLSELSGKETDADCVILNVFNIKSVREMSRNDEAGILVKASPNPVYFQDQSSLFASIQEGFDEQFVEVYAPASWGSLEEREDFCGQVRDFVHSIIERHCGGTIQGVRP